MVAWYDRQGNVIDMWEASRLGADPAYKRVAEDTIGPYWISTVWLGFDHGFMSGGPPLIFETMVFMDPKDEHALGPDIDMDRYPTEAAALAGHAQFVTLIRATLNEDVPVAPENETNGKPSE